MEVNNYVSPIYSGKDVSTVNKSSKDSLGIDDFLKLLSAQLANQDMMNPSSDTEFIAQLAQFSSLQAMDSLAKMCTINQSTDLVGKKVVVSKYNKDNSLVTVEGIVDKVTLFKGTPMLVINGEEYEYANVMEIKASAEEETADDSDKKDPSDSNSDSNNATDEV